MRNTIRKRRSRSAARRKSYLFRVKLRWEERLSRFDRFFLWTVKDWRHGGHDRHPGRCLCRPRRDTSFGGPGTNRRLLSLLISYLRDTSTTTRERIIIVTSLPGRIPREGVTTPLRMQDVIDRTVLLAVWEHEPPYGTETRTEHGGTERKRIYGRFYKGTRLTWPGLRKVTRVETATHYGVIRPESNR